MDGQTEVVSEGLPLVSETPEARIHRAVGEIAGFLKSEIAEKGGAEAFLRWLRGEDEEAG